VKSLESVSNMPSLSEITLENNPIEKSENLLKTLKAQFPSLQYYNLQKVSLLISSLSSQQQTLAEKINQKTNNCTNQSNSLTL